MTTALLFAATSLFHFSGGGDQALVDRAADLLKRPIVMLAVGVARRASFEFHYDDEKDLRRLLRAKTGLDVTLAGGLFPPAWPTGVGRVSCEIPYQRQFEPLRSKSRFKDGRISLRTEEREAATLAQIAALGLSRPLVWSRFYDRARLRFNVSNATEREFLAALADATGTRLVEEKAAFRLVTDARQYRPRALAMWRGIGDEGWRAKDPVRAADASYMLTLLPLSSDTLIQKGIDDTEVFYAKYARSWSASTPVHTFAWRRLEARFRVCTAEVQRSLRAETRPEDPVYGYIMDSGEPMVGYRNVEANLVNDL